MEGSSEEYKTRVTAVILKFSDTEIYETKILSLPSLLQYST